MLEAEDTDPERGDRLGRFIRNLGYLYKWLLLGVVVGVVAGFGAVVFYLALRYTTHFLLGYVAGYHLPTPLVEGGSPGSSHYQRPWALPLVTTAGALVSALIVAKFAPEASGHGTDSAIEAIHTDPRAQLLLQQPSDFDCLLFGHARDRDLRHGYLPEVVPHGPRSNTR